MLFYHTNEYLYLNHNINLNLVNSQVEDLKSGELLRLSGYSTRLVNNLYFNIWFLILNSLVEDLKSGKMGNSEYLYFNYTINLNFIHFFRLKT